MNISPSLGRVDVVLLMVNIQVKLKPEFSHDGSVD